MKDAMLKLEALAVVLDTGTDTLKAGFAGESGPSIVCPDVVCKVGEDMKGKPVVKVILAWLRREISENLYTVC